MLLGVVLMLWWRSAGHREFFRRRPEVVDPAVLAAAPPPDRRSEMAKQVLGYDGTEGARAALARGGGASPPSWATRSWSSSPTTSAGCGGEVHDYEEALREHGRAVLEEARGIAREAGVEYRARDARGVARPRRSSRSPTSTTRA